MLRLAQVPLYVFDKKKLRLDASGPINERRNGSPDGGRPVRTVPWPCLYCEDHVALRQVTESPEMIEYLQSVQMDTDLMMKKMHRCYIPRSHERTNGCGYQPGVYFLLGDEQILKFRWIFAWQSQGSFEAIENEKSLEEAIARVTDLPEEITASIHSHMKLFLHASINAQLPSDPMSIFIKKESGENFLKPTLGTKRRKRKNKPREATRICPYPVASIYIRHDAQVDNESSNSTTLTERMEIDHGMIGCDDTLAHSPIKQILPLQNRLDEEHHNVEGQKNKKQRIGSNKENISLASDDGNGNTTSLETSTGPLMVVTETSPSTDTEPHNRISMDSDNGQEKQNENVANYCPGPGEGVLESEMSSMESADSVEEPSFSPDDTSEEDHIEWSDENTSVATSDLVDGSSSKSDKINSLPVDHTDSCSEADASEYVAEHEARSQTENSVPFSQLFPAADSLIRGEESDVIRSFSSLQDGLLACQQSIRDTRNNKMMIGSRASKFDSISDFVHSVITNRGAGPETAMHICGAPGVGKSMCVQWCCNRVQEWAAANDSSGGHKPPPVVCTISGAQLQTLPSFADCMESVVLAIYQQLDCSFNRDFINRSSNEGLEKPTIILVFDEIDLMLTNKGLDLPFTVKERFVQEILSWATNPATNFGLICLSNSVDNDKARRLHVLGQFTNNITFETYGKEDLVEILKSRVDTTLVDEKVLCLVASRVSATCGDARLALNLCSNIVADFIASMPAQKLQGPYRDDAGPVIKMPHALKSLNRTTHKIKDMIEGLPQSAKAILCTISTISHRMGERAEGLSLQTLYSYCLEAFGNSLTCDNVTIDDFKLSLELIVDSGLFKIRIQKENGRFCDDVKLSQLSNQVPVRIDYLLQLKDVDDALQQTLLKQSYYVDIAQRARSVR